MYRPEFIIAEEGFVNQYFLSWRGISAQHCLFMTYNLEE